MRLFGSCVPMRRPRGPASTTAPSMTSVRLAAWKVSGRRARTPKASSATSTTVWIAMPPRMLLTATSSCPLAAAL